MGGRTGLQHLTLDTGHTRVSFLDEIAPPVLAGMVPDTVTGEHSLDPWVPGCTIKVTVDGPAALVTVFRDGDPLVTFGVAADEDGAAGLRRVIRAGWSPWPSAVPFLVAWLEPGIALHPGDTAWLGDFERCWAWAWLSTRDAPPGGTEPPPKALSEVTEGDTGT